ncbi:FRG domain-containing protein [Chloroflexota bacterium]
MKAISRRIYSHLSSNEKDRQSTKEIRESEALDVNTFSELMYHVARISYHNADLSLFFRGQDEDYRTKVGNISTLYPTIYRAFPRGSRPRTTADRFTLLEAAERELRYEFEKQKFLGRTKIDKFKEVRWALLQHYDVCDTPLLDVTHSLRVACSFALDSGGDYSYVFALGFPHVSGSISYSVEEELLNVKLLSICPPRAKRPYFQEGFLVGSFPSSDTGRSASLDIGRRLIAKFRLRNSTFEDNNFTRIPHETLYPSGDQMQRVCERISGVLQ